MAPPSSSSSSITVTLVTIVLACLVVTAVFLMTTRKLFEYADELDDPPELQKLIKPTVTDNSTADPPHPPEDFLVLITAECSPYFDWQSLAAYETAKRVWPEAEVVRLLHCCESKRGEYSYFDMMPSVYTSDCSKRNGDEYPPLNRPVALLEFFEHFDPAELPQTYIVIMDADTLLRRRMNHVRVSEGKPVGQLASILVPKMYTAAKTIFGDDPDRIKAMPLYDFGSPYILHKNDAHKLARVWRDHTNRLREDSNAKNVIGWTCEMYSYITACAELGLDTTVRSDLQARWPYTDSDTKDFCSYHYDLTHEDKGESWCKRNYMTEDLLAPTANTTMPVRFTPNKYTASIISKINNALTKWRTSTSSTPKPDLDSAADAEKNK
jgi:hypothetical protein